MKNIFLHVGQYKTGSTSLQKYLIQERLYQETQDIFYCCDGRYSKSNNRHFYQCWGFSMNYLDKKINYLNISQDQIKLIHEKTLRDIKDTTCQTIIISTEHLFDTTTKNLEKLRDTLNPLVDNLYVIMYLRDLIPFVNSSYIQRITKGNFETTPFKTFLKHVVERKELQYDYYANLKRFETIFSKEKLIIRHFGSNLYGNNIVRDFFQILGKEVVKAGAVENRNVSATVAECFRSLNVRNSGKKNIVKIQNFMDKNIESFQFGSKTFLSSNSARLIEENYQIEHKEISNKYGITLGFEYDNIEQSEFKITTEESDQFVKLIRHLL